MTHFCKQQPFGIGMSPHTLSRLGGFMRLLPYRADRSPTIEMLVRFTLDIVEQGMAEPLAISIANHACDGREVFEPRQQGLDERQKLFWFETHFHDLPLREKMLLSHLLFVEQIGAAQRDESVLARWRGLLAEANTDRELLRA